MAMLHDLLNSRWHEIRQNPTLVRELPLGSTKADSAVRAAKTMVEKATMQPQQRNSVFITC